jgi:hypothetical protein
MSGREHREERRGSAIRRHLRTNVIGYVALFCVITVGTAGALPGRNTVNSGDIVPEAVRGGDLDGDAVTAPKIHARAFRGKHFPDVVITARMIADSTFTSEIVREGGKSGDYQIANDAIQSNEVSQDTLTRTDLASGSVWASELGSVVIRPGAPTEITDADGGDEDWTGGSASASCIAGEQLLSGYGEWPDASGSEDRAIAEQILNPATGNVVIVGIQNGGDTKSIRAVAVCLPV